jgi:hypothetical protein
MAKRRREESREPSALANGAAVQGTPNDADRRAVLGSVLATFDGSTRTIGVLHYLDGFTQEKCGNNYRVHQRGPQRSLLPTVCYRPNRDRSLQMWGGSRAQSDGPKRSTPFRVGRGREPVNGALGPLPP